MTRYIFMVFAGACSFGILSTFVKLAYLEGYTAAEISVSQAFTGLLVLGSCLLLYARQRRESLLEGLTRKACLELLFTGAAIGMTTFLYYVSVQYIAASVAIVILMQFTWIGLLLDWLIFRKKPSSLQLLSAIIILAGTVMASGIAGISAAHISITGVCYAFGSASCYAVYVVANSRAGSGLNSLKKSVGMMCGSTLAIFLVNAQSLLTSTHMDAGLLKWALFLGLFGTIIPPVLFARGIPRVGAAVAAIVMTAELPVAVCCSHLVLGEAVSLLQWTGVVIMLLSMGLLRHK